MRTGKHTDKNLELMCTTSRFRNRCAWATRISQDGSKTLRKALVDELQEKNAEKEQLFDSHCILGAEELTKERLRPGLVFESLTLSDPKPCKKPWQDANKSLARSFVRNHFRPASTRKKMQKGSIILKVSDNSLHRN